MRALAALGHEAVHAPLLAIEPVADAEIPSHAFQAVLVTSANGVRALAQGRGARRMAATPVLAVGAASSAAAKAAGFSRVEDAAGDLSALCALVRARLDPGGGPLLYAAGRVVSGDLKGLLEADGFTVERVVLYDAVEADELAPHVAELIRERKLDAVLLYSPRGAKIWRRIVTSAGLSAAAMGLVHFCLSPAVARALLEDDAWQETVLRIAAQPNEPALFNALADFLH